MTSSKFIKKSPGAINSETEKGAPVSADVILIEDSADSFEKKKVQVGNLPGGGGGEANTASNVGTAGVGVYKTKVGVDLKFKKINAGSSKVTVTDDTGDDEVDIDVSEGNVVHQNLSGAGTNDHAAIDTHIGSTSNPHSTSIVNIGGGTLAELNAAVSDATLDDSSSTRTPSAHNLGGSEHGSDTLANLNSKISDATLDDSSDSRTPSSHASTHENAGGDEITHDNLSDAGTNSHTQIDTHIGSTANPHSVDKADVSLSSVTDDAQLKRADGDIDTFTEKVSPVGADLILIEDSGASNAKKKVQITNLPGGADADAIHDNVGSEISAITEKVTPVNADLLVIEDSAASNAKKRVQIGNLPGGASGPTIKAGEVSGSSFTGNPKKYTLTFGTAFPDANYSLSVIGEDAREWAYESKAASSIIINASINGAFTGIVTWIAVAHSDP